VRRHQQLDLRRAQVVRGVRRAREPLRGEHRRGVEDGNEAIHFRTLAEHPDGQLRGRLRAEGETEDDRHDHREGEHPEERFRLAPELEQARAGDLEQGVERLVAHPRRPILRSRADRGR
jgi:hypothetical protein